MAIFPLLLYALAPCFGYHLPPCEVFLPPSEANPSPCETYPYPYEINFGFISYTQFLCRRFFLFGHSSFFRNSISRVQVIGSGFGSLLFPCSGDHLPSFWKLGFSHSWRLNNFGFSAYTGVAEFSEQGSSGFIAFRPSFEIPYLRAFCSTRGTRIPVAFTLSSRFSLLRFSTTFAVAYWLKRQLRWY